ncbi:MAG: hypothetical protein GY856_54310 [bacterium]|nr:hypothetical protein [bacterium]
MLSRKRILRSSTPFHRRPPAAGFTMVEIMIALLVLIEVMLAILVMFDATNKLARSQTFLTELQQSQRVAQQQVVSLVRMSGRGGLVAYVALDAAAPFNGDPDTAVPRGLLITNNHPGGELDPGNADTEVLAGTDVITVRGVLSTPIYTVNSESPTHFVVNDNNPTDLVGTIEIYEDVLPGTPLGNDIEDLRKVRDEGLKVPLIVVSDRDDAVYGLLEFDFNQGDLDPAEGVPASIVTRINGGDNSADYLGLSNFTITFPGGSFKSNLDGVGFVGIIEEYRFYIRPVQENPNDPQSRVAHRLAVARFLAGTTTFLDFQDVADNIIDLQVALGVDLNRDGVILDAGDATDEWLFNHSADDVNFVDPDNSTMLGQEPLYYVRLSTIAFTDRPDVGYVAPPLTQLEDHVYGSTSTFNQRPEDRYRRSVHTDLIDLRNTQ